jgi:hypothetical protein
MRYKRILVVLMAGSIVLALTACNAPTTIPEPTDLAATPLVTTEQIPASSGQCANPLYPVVQGATWTYASAGPSGPFTYTDTITEVRADGFTLTSQFADLTRTQEWSCAAEGLLALTFGGDHAGGLSADGLKAEFTTTNPTGITLPSVITPGMGWTYGFNIQGTMTFADQSADGTGTVETALKEAGTESVTVPAGTFNATKVEATSTFNLIATYQGLDVPVTLTGVTTLWYAPGVGLVKSEESGDVAGQSFSATTELQSYNIP